MKKLKNAPAILFKKIPSNALFRFLIVGGVCTSISMLTFFILKSYSDFGPGLSAGFSYFIGLGFSYVLNRRFAFQICAPYSFFQAWRYFFVYGGTMIIQMILSEILFSYSYLAHHHVCSILTYIFITAVTTTFNFLGLHYLVFNKNRGQSPQHK